MLLLHICCGPCAAYPFKYLKETNQEFEGIFYNPNIHPFDEFEKREQALRQLQLMENINIHYFDDFEQNKWEIFEGEEEERCRFCYSKRIDFVAKYASNNGFTSFSTTLLISPYQKHDIIIELGEIFAKKYNVEFKYYDFRLDFRKGQNIAKEMHLYRQKYCGCIKSLPNKS